MAKVRKGIPPQLFIGNICVKEAGNKGRGVFATQAIKKGETIEISPAIRIPTEDQSLLSYTKLADYAFGTDDSSNESLIGLGYSSLYNHRSDSNAQFFAGKNVIIIQAIKNIKKGEEIFVDYGWHDNPEDYEWE